MPWPEFEHKLGTAHDRWGDPELAESYYEEAVKTLGEGVPGELARLYGDWSMAAFHRGQIGRALWLAQKGLELAEDADDAGALAQVHTVLGILRSRSGDLKAARDHLSRSLALAASAPSQEARMAALQNLAMVCWHDGEIDESRCLVGEALELSVAHGDRHREAALHNTLADLLHVSGAEEEAMKHLKRAVAIYAEIGVESGAVRPEVWKLTDW